MTVYETINVPAQQLPLTVLFLLLTLHAALILAAFRDGRSRRLKLFLLVHFAFSTAVFWLYMSLISWTHFDPEGMKALPAGLAAFGSLPVSAVMLYEAAAAGFLAFVLWETFRYRKNHPTRDNIKETMDLLPVGIAYSQQDGTAVFRNLVMDHLSQDLTGRLMTDLTAFRAAACSDKDQAQVPLNGRVWQMDTRRTDDGKHPLQQLTAADITEQAGIVADLEAKNKKLKDIHLRLEIYNRQAERIIIAQELLTARMTVHNELGHVLLESRHYMNDPSSIDEQLLLQALKNANTYLLREYEKDDTAVDPLAEAISTAGVIGVKVALTGIPPAECTPPRVILAAAVRECATNTVKHAEGDRLEVDMRHPGTAFIISLRSNGTPPREEIRESGGLLSLRTLVERHHGAMRVAISPDFSITIELPQDNESSVKMY